MKMINRIRPVITCTIKYPCGFKNCHITRTSLLPAPPYYPQQQLFTNKLTHYVWVIGRKLLYQSANLLNSWNTRQGHPTDRFGKLSVRKALKEAAWSSGLGSRTCNLEAPGSSPALTPSRSCFSVAPSSRDNQIQ